ncbi:MAG TPA: endonuclease/exonuclease/phosphatase family protein, partial [Vicinamibacteria bacterium]|nr:endonuclease/exonuclease/phosphatase family protein [Vicinamibacteria bacterium]
MTAGAAPLLRVLTLNCWLLRWGQLRVAHDLARRAAAIPEAVAATGADLVLLQEVWLPGLARGLAAGLERTGYRHLALGAPPTAARVFGDGLLVASRHPLSAPRRLAFSRRSVWYEHLIAKGALAVEVTPPGADPLCVATAHLAVVRYDVRRREFRRDD